MAREYGKLHTSFWTSKSIRALSEDGRTLAAYLLTCEHGSIIGAFRLPAAYACDDLGWSVERFKKGFKTLEEHGFAVYCRDTQWVCIVKYLDWNPLENPNQRKAAEKALLAMPDTCFAEGLRKGCVTVPEQATATATSTASEKKEQKTDAPLALPEWLPADAWAMWVAHRGNKKFKPTAQAFSLRTLKALHDEGHDPRRVIEQSIERAWTGLFPIKANSYEPAHRSGAGRLSVVDRIQANVDAIERRESRDAIPGTAVLVRTG